MVINVNKKLLIPTLGLAAAVGLGALGVRAVKADDTASYPPFIQRLAERFGLNEDEVKTFFDEQKQEKLELMQQAKEDRLNQAVEDGVITEEQKEALQNRWEEMWQERQQEKEQHREEMEAWFEEQGIDREAFMQYGGFGHRGFHKMGRMGFK